MSTGRKGAGKARVRTPPSREADFPIGRYAIIDFRGSSVLQGFVDDVAGRIFLITDFDASSNSPILRPADGHGCLNSGLISSVERDYAPDFVKIIPEADLQTISVLTQLLSEG